MNLSQNKVNSLEAGYRSSSFKLLTQLLLVTLFSTIFGLLIARVFPHFYWEQIPFHSVVEALGGFIAITFAFVLHRFEIFSKDQPSYFWVIAALVSMGTLDLLHGVVYPGEQFVWLHSVANFLGGVLIFFVWLPERLTLKLKNYHIPVIILLTSATAGIATLIFPELIPIMVHDGKFSIASKILNLTGGLGFIFASAYFIVKSIKFNSLQFPVLANHCLLFGTSSLLFEFSELWDGVWWEWHILRFIAYGLMLYFFILLYKSDRKKYEDDLQRLSQAIQYNGEAVMITDALGAIEYVNPAFTEITGYSLESVIGENPRVLKGDFHDYSFYKGMWDKITQGKVWQNRVVNRCKDGSFYPALLTISSVKNAEGEIERYVSVQQNLSSYEALESEFHQAQKMEAIGTLVGGIAHDFNNSLAGITGNIYLAKQTVRDMPETYQMMDEIEKLSFRAAGMIQQMLTFARKDLKSMNPMAIDSFLKEAIKLNKITLPENIAFIYDIPDTDMQISGDINLLQQVIINLLNNARDAVSDVKKPSITVKLEHYKIDQDFQSTHPESEFEDFACITVTDNGTGITDEDIEHIFEPFYTTKEVGKGTGLGLAMVYGAVQSHGGTIEVESNMGAGTAFKIYLPILDGSQENIIKRLQEEILEGDGETILLVDDEPSVVKTGKDVLTSLGYNILTASDGIEAVEKHQDSRNIIDLTILDVVMPRMGGIDAAKEIRKLNSKAKILFATGYDRTHSLRKGDHIDSEAVLVKPYSVAQISQLIRKLLTTKV